MRDGGRRGGRLLFLLQHQETVFFLKYDNLPRQLRFQLLKSRSFILPTFTGQRFQSVLKFHWTPLEKINEIRRTFSISTVGGLLLYYFFDFVL